MSLKYGFLLSLILVIIFTACSTSQFGWQPESVREKEINKDTQKYKEDFDPLLLKETEIVVEPTERQLKPQQEPIALDFQEEPEAIKTEIQEVPGFAVQLIAIEDEARARDFKKEAMFKLSSNVYWVFESGMYKIRTGNCETRKEAEEVLREVESKGFDGWIVRTRIQLEVEVPE